MLKNQFSSSQITSKTW